MTGSQRRSNLTARRLCGHNEEKLHVSEELKRQMSRSIGCGKKLDVNEHNQMSRRFSCKYRFCTTCTRLGAWKRDMALYPSVHAICEANRREPKKNSRLWFVTLTLPTCEASELPERIDHIQQEWRLIYKELKRDSSKGYVNGLRKLEINESPKKKKPETYLDFKYHAHLHVLIQGRNNALYLRRKWLERHPEAKKWAQDIRPFDQEKGSLVELLKYLAKPVSDVDINAQPAHYEAHGHIFECLRGRRIIFSYGSVKATGKWQADFDENGRLVIRINDKITEAYDTSSDKHKRRIMAMLGQHKAKASRPIAETIWNYVDGHYVNDVTREQLCSEADVKAAAASVKDGLKAYETEKKWREGRDHSVLDKAVAKREAAHEAKKEKAREWQKCDKPRIDCPRIRGVNEEMKAAATNGQLEQVRELLPNVPKYGKEQGLYAAAAAGQLEVVKELLPHTGKHGRSEAFEEATYNGRLDVASYLYTRATKASHLRALIAARKNRHLAVIRFLKAEKAKYALNGAKARARQLQVCSNPVLDI